MNSNLKTIGGGLLVVSLVLGSRSRREPTIEGDAAARAVVEQTIRSAVTEFNPYASVKPRALVDFEIIDLQVTRPGLGGLVDSFGGASGYAVYVRFRESGRERCMTTALKWNPRSEAWSAFRGQNPMDRCEPLW